MSIASDIIRINNAKLDMISAIEEKGVAVPSGSRISDFAELIAQIEVGPGPGPEPSYEYVLLQNFVEGHSTGTPLYSASWITTVLYPDWDHDDYEYGDNYDDIGATSTNNDLADNTVGATLIDTVCPVDFSKYGISNGVPYGMINGDAEEGWQGTSLNFDLDSEHFNPNSVTVECWAKGRSSTPGGTYYNPTLNEYIFSLGRNNDNSNKTAPYWSLTLNIVGANQGEDAVYLTLDVDGDERPIICAATVTDDNDFLDSGMSVANWLGCWHHYVVSINATDLYFFIDGKKIADVPLSTVEEFDYTWWTHSGGDHIQHEEHFNGPISGIISQIPGLLQLKGLNTNSWDTFDGGYAQVAVCNQCKWTDDFTVPTEAY